MGITPQHDVSTLSSTAVRLGLPQYLRVVVTRSCPLACGYCHAEGDPGKNGLGPNTDERTELVLAAVANGIRKIKLLGGEPLVATEAPKLIAGIKRGAPHVDLSIITSGVGPPGRLDALFEAGLDRANLSIHGWGKAAFAQRKGTEKMLAFRDQSLASLIARGRPLKLNYVYGGPADLPDLGDLLGWAADRGALVNVLDDLGKDIGAAGVLHAVRQLRGPEASLRVSPDPDSLDTLRLTWSDGLEVEVKHLSLGVLAPWVSCAKCPVRSRCREGIHAVRLTYDGVFRTCMDRPDIGLALVPILRREGQGGVAKAMRTWLREQS